MLLEVSLNFGVGEEMQELNANEIDMVDGAGVGANIAAGVASVWAGTVVGAAVGSIVPGVGSLAGAGIGFAFGVAQVCAWSMATATS
ncbi:hypothetical protein HF313_08385 [Massilia atriviolacea]|uniref:Bacteriocin n=1 Tax=Massilia atriviolacea TaxID=2495579 RepID=A0A430HC17_9BURK|nr:hypothetical protein [Massilia atriviolacea]RSZ55041.1 hypothetical protein EJB06_31575 [Massilia atriviolacea]